MDERNPAAIILDSVRFFNRQGNEDVLALEETVNCKLFVNPIDKAGGQEYIFSSRADGVLKTKRTAPQEVCKTMKKNINIINSRLCRRRARSC